MKNLIYSWENPGNAGMVDKSLHIIMCVVNTTNFGL